MRKEIISRLTEACTELEGLKESFRLLLIEVRDFEKQLNDAAYSLTRDIEEVVQNVEDMPEPDD